VLLAVGGNRFAKEDPAKSEGKWLGLGYGHGA